MAEFLAGASGWYDHELQFLAGASGWYDHELQKSLSQQTASIARLSHRGNKSTRLKELSYAGVTYGTIGRHEVGRRGNCQVPERRKSC